MKDSKVKANQKKKVKSIFMRIAGPALIFFICVIVMLVVYANKQNTLITNRINEEIRTTTEGYAGRIMNEISSLEKASELITTLIGRDENKNDDRRKVELLRLLREHTDAYMALAVNRQGKGVSDMGGKIKIGENHAVIDWNNPEHQVVYTENDGVTGKSAVVVAMPVQDSPTFLLAYYDLELMSSFIDVREYDRKSWGSVIDGSGNVVFAKSASSTGLDTGFALLESYKQSAGEEAYAGLCDKMAHGQRSHIRMNIGDTYTYISLAPLGIGDWYFAIGISDSHVDGLVQKEWRPTKEAAVQIAVALAIFMCVVVIGNYAIRRTLDSNSVALQKKADMDLLTELNNKIATERKIKEYMEEHPREQALMFIFDIDNFKKINDTRGHAFGDEVLRNIGMRLKAEFRSSDIIGRVGGDEFILFLKDIQSDEILVKEAMKVARLFQNFEVGQYSKYSVTSSVGCAVYPWDSATFEGLYKAADKGLYKAKKRGKNQLAFYEEDDMGKVPHTNVDNMPNE